MKTERLIESGLLHSGEPRHYLTRQCGEIPRLRPEERDALSEALYRRQKVHAPRTRDGGRGLLHLWQTLRNRRLER